MRMWLTNVLLVLMGMRSALRMKDELVAQNPGRRGLIALKGDEGEERERKR